MIVVLVIGCELIKVKTFLKKVGNLKFLPMSFSMVVYGIVETGVVT